MFPANKITHETQIIKDAAFTRDDIGWKCADCGHDNAIGAAKCAKCGAAHDAKDGLQETLYAIRKAVKEAAASTGNPEKFWRSMPEEARNYQDLETFLSAVKGAKGRIERGYRDATDADKIQKFVCKNPNCKPVTLPGRSTPSAGPGVVKEFRFWSPVGKQKTPGCLSCGVPMAPVK